MTVIGEERAPALTGRSGWAAAPVAADRAGTDGDAQLEQLAADAFGAPVRVLARHRCDQLADLCVQPWTSQPVAGPPAPEQALAPAVPAQHCLGPDQEQVASPVPVQSPNEEPEELVPSSEARTTPGAESDLELLAKEQVLDDKALTAVDGGDEGGQNEPDEFEHRGRIADHKSLQLLVRPFAPLQAVGGQKSSRGQTARSKTWCRPPRAGRETTFPSTGRRRATGVSRPSDR